MEIIEGNRKHVGAWKENARNKRKKWVKAKTLNGKINEKRIWVIGKKESIRILKAIKRGGEIKKITIRGIQLEVVGSRAL